MLVSILFKLLPEVLISLRLRYEAGRNLAHLEDLLIDSTRVLVGVSDCIDAATVIVISVLGLQRNLAVHAHFGRPLIASIGHRHMSVWGATFDDRATKLARCHFLHRFSFEKEFVSLIFIQFLHNGYACVHGIDLPWELGLIEFHECSTFLCLGYPSGHRPLCLIFLLLIWCFLCVVVPARIESANVIKVEISIGWLVIYLKRKWLTIRIAL